MADGINVNIGADTRSFDQAVKAGMVDPLEDAQRTLEELGGGSAGDQLTDTLRDQQHQTTVLKDDIRDLNRTIADGARSSSRTQSSESHRATVDVSEGFDEMKDSARSNAIETAASFDGSFSSIAGGAQGVASEFLAAFGPLGMVAGLGLAAGIGAVVKSIDDATAATEAEKAATADLAGEYLDAGRAGRRTFDNITSSIKAMATSTDGKDVILTLQSAFDKAQAAGADYQAVVQAIASGSPAEIARAKAAVDRLTEAHKAADRANTHYGDNTAGVASASTAASESIGAALDKAAGQARNAARAEQLAARAGMSDLQLKNDLLNQLQGGYDDAAGSVDDYLNKEKTTLKVGPYIAAMEKRRDALEEYKNALAEADLSPAAKKFLESQGSDAAAAMMHGYKTASPAQKRQLNEIWSTAGDTSADSYKSAIGKNLREWEPAPPRIPRPVVPAPDTSAIDAYIRSPQVVSVIIEGRTRAGTRVF